MREDIRLALLLLDKASRTHEEQGALKSMVDRMDADGKKQLKESHVFIRFAATTRLLDDPFDHQNEAPPRPDISVSADGRKYYFELSEITDKLLAKALSNSAKTGSIGGLAISPIGPLETRLKRKCESTYQIDNANIDLLLYYWRHEPMESVPEYMDSKPELTSLLGKSPFSRIWVFQLYPPEVLWSFSSER